MKAANIRLAKTAGFCFGVNKAVNMVRDLLDEGRQVCTLGPIIHNPQVVEELTARGVRIVEVPEEVPAGCVLVIRSHGVAQEIYDKARELGLDLCDATCPFVAKIHRIVAEKSANGYTVLIAGDEGHPEVMGIRGHCSGPSFVFSSAQDLEEWIKTDEFGGEKQVIMVAQTTFNMNVWEKCSEIAKNHYTNLLIFDTICNATAERQNEAVILSQECDKMVIVGGRQSSNTAKLRDVCSENCPTLLIESAEELDKRQFIGARAIGITAEIGRASCRERV